MNPVMQQAQGNLLIKDRKSTRLNSSHGYISYAVFCLKKKKNHALLSHSLCGFIPSHLISPPRPLSSTRVPRHHLPASTPARTKLATTTHTHSFIPRL